MIRRLKQPKALVLVVVVYIVAALSMLACALAFRSRIAIKETTLLVERLQQDRIALAACVQARSVLAADDGNIDCLDEPWYGWHKLAHSEITNQLAGAEESTWEVNWRLIDESSKINVNLAYPDLLLGLECLDEAAVASILDWIDQDDVPNPDGAENDYYLSLTAGYNCKNAPLDNIEELLLIKGITPAIYYGSNLAEMGSASTEFTDGDSQNNPVGLCNLLTVYGNGRININTASEEVLDAIPILSEGAVNEIISCQESATRKFSSIDDIENNGNFTAADKLSLMQVAKFSSNHFQLHVKVRRKGERFWCEYVATVERQGKNTKVLNWQRSPRTVLKDKTALVAGTDEGAYSQGLK